MLRFLKKLEPLSKKIYAIDFQGSADGLISIGDILIRINISVPFLGHPLVDSLRKNFWAPLKDVIEIIHVAQRSPIPG
jgi:hypothetical protein